MSKQLRVLVNDCWCPANEWQKQGWGEMDLSDQNMSRAAATVTRIKQHADTNIINIPNNWAAVQTGYHKDNYVIRGRNEKGWGDWYYIKEIDVPQLNSEELQAAPFDGVTGYNELAGPVASQPAPGPGRGGGRGKKGRSYKIPKKNKSKKGKSKKGKSKKRKSR